MCARPRWAQPATLATAFLTGVFTWACADGSVGPTQEESTVRLEISFERVGPTTLAFAAIGLDAPAEGTERVAALLQGELRYDPARLRAVRHEAAEGATLAFDIRGSLTGRLAFLALADEGLRDRLGTFVFEVVDGGEPEIYLEIDRAARLDGGSVSVRSVGTRVVSARPGRLPVSTRIAEAPGRLGAASAVEVTTGVIGDCSADGAIDFDDVFAVVDLAVRAVTPPPVGTEAFARCNPVVDGAIDYRDVAWTARAWMIVASGFDPWDYPQGPAGEAWYTEAWRYPDLPAAYGTGALASAGNDGSKQLLRGVDAPGGDSTAIRMRFNRASGRRNQAVGVTIVPPGIDRIRPRDFWLEVWVRFSDNWSTINGPAALDAPADYEVLAVTPDGHVRPNGQWKSTVGSDGDALRMVVGGEDGSSIPGGRRWPFPGGIGSLLDGEWHRFRYHGSMNGSGTPSAWWLTIDDHPPFHVATGLDVDPGGDRYFREWTLSGPLARGAANDMWVDFAPARLHFSDPGWTWDSSEDTGAEGVWYEQRWEAPRVEALLSAGYQKTEYPPSEVSLIDVHGPGFGRAMRATFRPGGGQVGMNIYFPRARVDRPKEIWFEYYARHSDNWTTEGPGSGSAGHKHLFLFDQEETSAGRWEVMAGTFGSQTYMQIAGGRGAGANAPQHTPWDGQWRLYRCHARMHRIDGAWECWVDGIHFTWGTGNSERRSDLYFNQIALSRNMNRGVSQPMTLDFGPLRVWTHDPGW